MRLIKPGTANLCAWLLVLSSTRAFAQRAEHQFDLPQDTARTHAAWTPLRIVKWSTLAAATATAAYGFAQNRSADREYEEIEKLCTAQLSECSRTSPDGAYTDAALEARYQNVVRRDDHARIALLAGQAGIAASVVLFILDLPGAASPKDIPYEPRPIRVGFRNRDLIIAAHIVTH